jgi:hypothetical protein
MNMAGSAGISPSNPSVMVEFAHEDAFFRRSGRRPLKPVFQD